MQTITVARINQAQVDTGRFMRRIRQTNVRRDVRGAEDSVEELGAPFAERLQTEMVRLHGIATAVIRRTRTGIVAETTLRNGYLERVEVEQQIEDFARTWIGHRSYALYCFLAGFPGGTYPGHRLLVAQALTQDGLDDEQQVVIPIRYDLPCVRERFGANIWDQNFRRTDPIRRGRIRGTAMRDDPLYPEFQNIETFIGVEIPITGSQQMVKVFGDGRLQFMGLQPVLLENPANREAALDIVVQVLERLSPCEL